MKYLTYNEWQDEGFQVMKGERSRKRNDQGETVFSEAQVEDMNNDGELDFGECHEDGPDMGD